MGCNECLPIKYTKDDPAFFFFFCLGSMKDHLVIHAMFAGRKEATLLAQ